MMNHFSLRASNAPRSFAGSRSFRRVGLLVLATLAATSQILGGCVVARQIGDASGEGGGNGETTGTGTTTTGTTGTTTTATTGGGGSAGGGESGSGSIAMLNAQITADNKSMWTSPGEALGPTTLIIVIATDHAQSCAMPVFDIGSSTSFHQAIFGLAPSVQKVGKYDLASTEVSGVEQSWLGDGMGNGGGGWAPLTQGTIEILSIDATSIKVHIEQPPEGAPAYNGDFVVPRCP